jgi:hypothetical protein
MISVVRKTYIEVEDEAALDSVLCAAFCTLVDCDVVSASYLRYFRSSSIHIVNKFSRPDLDESGRHVKGRNRTHWLRWADPEWRSRIRTVDMR